MAMGQMGQGFVKVGGKARDRVGVNQYPQIRDLRNQW